MNAFRLPLDGDHDVTRLNRCIDFFAFGQIKAILIYKRTLGKAGTATVQGFVDETLWESRLLSAIKLAHRSAARSSLDGYAS